MKNRHIEPVLLLLMLLCYGPLYAIEKSRPNADTIHVVGHAHMDMNWLWSYPETVKMCNDNLRQTVAFMEEFPDFTMIQSQAAIYREVERVDPPLFEKVKKYVGEGRLEIAGGMWTEGDMNLSSGEAISRSFLMGQRYFQEHFGKMARVGWLPDNFGHISQMPQILKLSNCDYYYFHRCKPYLGTFWWTGPDSSTVLCYASHTYNGKITRDPGMKDQLGRVTPGGHRILQITGVGDHGGGPTRADIEMVHELDVTPGFPAIKFTTAEDFFRQSALEMDGRPTHRGEMQFIFEGCYTTVAGIKEGNRNSEASLYSAEYLSSVRWMEGEDYPIEELNQLWEKVVFNQFHDILPGSCIHEASQDAIADLRYVISNAKEIRDFAFRKLADEIRVRTDMGQPIIAINQQPSARKALVIAEVYSNETPATAELARWFRFYDNETIKPVDTGQGPYPTVLVRDGSGKTYPGQILRGESQPPGYRFDVGFVADLPAGGYKTFYIDPQKPGSLNESMRIGENRFETDFFSIIVDLNSGEIVSLFDKRTQTEYASGDKLHKHTIFVEEAQGRTGGIGVNGTSAWTIGEIIKTEDITDIEKVEVTEEGPVRACIETIKHWGNSKIIQRTYIYKSYPRIDYKLEVHWFEQGDNETSSPMLRAVFPMSLRDVSFYSQVPFDVVERPVEGDPIPSHLQHSTIHGSLDEITGGQEVPAQRWVDVSNGKVGMALLNRTKYGHSYVDGALRLTLLRSPGYPDQYPNQGKFNIEYALFPHSGDWKNDVWQEGDVFNVPAYAAEPPSLALGQDHSSLPGENTYISLEGQGVFMSGIKRAEDTDELIVRLVETHGEEREITLSLPVKIAYVRRLNLIELPLQDLSFVKIKGRTLSTTIRPHEILTLGITFNE